MELGIVEKVAMLMPADPLPMIIERNDPQHPAGGEHPSLMPGAVPAMSAELTAEAGWKQRCNNVRSKERLKLRN